jgi:hypothetical protein
MNGLPHDAPQAGKVFDRDPPLVVDLMEKALQFASAPASCRWPDKLPIDQ